MRRKTTLYLEEDDIRELKRIALEEPNQNMTTLIKQAIRQFINIHRNKKRSFEELMKYKGSAKENYFGDGVDFQRSVREEWKD